MKRFFTFLVRFFFGCLLFFVVFFFWASSATLDTSDYEKLLINQYETNNKTDSIYSIVTYNIGYLSGMTNNKPVAKPKELFDKNLQHVLQETAKVQPDIITFQEIDFNASRSYKINQQNKIASLGYNYVAQAVNWDKRYVPFPSWPPSMHFGKVVSGQSILSKYPIKEHQRIELDRVATDPFYRDAIYLDRLAQVVKIELEGKEVVVINVHLEAFDKPTRVKQFRFVLDLFHQYKKTNPTFLLGDFNSEARDKDAVIQQLFVQDDVGNAVFNQENPQNTFNTNTPYKRIDYIFYTKNTIEYVTGKVLIGFGQASDHLPVEMQFKLK